MKAEQGLNQCALPGAIRAEQADGSALERAVEILQDRAPIEEDGQIVEFNGWNQPLPPCTTFGFRGRSHPGGVMSQGFGRC